MSTSNSASDTNSEQVNSNSDNSSASDTSLSSKARPTTVEPEVQADGTINLNVSDYKLDWDDRNHEEDTFISITPDKGLFTPQSNMSPALQGLSLTEVNGQPSHSVSLRVVLLS
jgi:hypothetical protein